MLIRNATLQMSATECACMDVRVMNGCVWEMGAALVKGLYESETDLRGDVLMPGRRPTAWGRGRRTTSLSDS